MDDRDSDEFEIEITRNTGGIGNQFEPVEHAFLVTKSQRRTRSRASCAKRATPSQEKIVMSESGT